MEKVSILHLITAAKNASPFDVNMAFDADFDKIMPYTHVELNEVAGLVQDAIFSRGSTGIKHEAVFIGGRDIDLTMDMLEAARKAMQPPFQVSVFADPSGAFTTAAAMLAKVEFHLNRHFNSSLKDKKIAIFGATGPVGGCLAVIAAKQGAQVELVAHNSLETARDKAQRYNQRYGTNIGYVDGTSEAAKQAVLNTADIALCAAAAGVRVLTAAQIAQAESLKIIADVNAVSPAGAEGVDVMADGVEIAKTGVLGIGALAIGNLKYTTQHNMLKQMLTSGKPVYLEFMAAFEVARSFDLNFCDKNPSFKKLIIAATSARGYAQAASASGYEVITLDTFADEDTRQVAKQAFKLKLRGQSVGADDFKRVFTQINLEDVAGFLYGSLFDAVPDLLDWVAERVPLIGNAPTVMRAAKQYGFFKLLDDLQIIHPEVCLKAPAKHFNWPDDWISKQIGGSGGTHIRPASQDVSGDYFQRKVVGKSVSMLFVADGKTAQLVGFNQQFIEPTPDFPYRFAGAVSGVVLPVLAQKQFCHAAQQLTATLGLRGINSLDAIFEGETLRVLELNPRLSATFHLYPNLFPMHMQGCAGDLADFSSQLESANAQLIVYADSAIEIPFDFVWPNWVADLPFKDAESSVKITENEPICTVLAEAQDAESAHVLVLQRAQKLREMIYD